MEALYFLKFWKPNPSQKWEDQLFSSSNQNTVPNTVSPTNIGPEDEEEGDDSFFELDLITTTSPIDNTLNLIATSSDPKHSITRSSVTPARNCITRASSHESYSYRFEFDPNNHSFTSSKASKPKKTGPCREPSSDSISKRKVLPIEPSLKPQSPISLLKSAPSLKVLTFKKSKSMARRELEEEQGSLECSVKVSVGNRSPALARDNSLRRHIIEDPFVRSNYTEEWWKPGKYLKLIYRPLHGRVSRKEKVTRAFSSGEAAMGSPSPSCSPLIVDPLPRKERGPSGSGGIRVVYKKLGKSKSASVAAAAAATVRRRDDSLTLHHDGIQGAILHCKKSFNSSRECSPLSRFAGETLREYSLFEESPRTSSESNLI